MKLDIKPVEGTQEVEVQVSFRLPRGGAANEAMSFEQIDEALAAKLNQIGSGTTEHLLGDYDSEGDALTTRQGLKWTSKGRGKRLVETPYGAVPVLCHVYQTSAGGRVRVPLEERARLIGSATPRMARMTAAKLAEMGCGAVARDWESNHLRPLSKSFVQDMDLLLERLRGRYPGARVVGLSDGASDLQGYLAKRCDEHLLDFHHAAEYLTGASAAFSAEGGAESPQAQAWARRQRAILRDEPGGALQVLASLRRRLRSSPSAKTRKQSLPKLTQAQRDALQSTATYYTNHIGSMDYAGWQQKGQPIGSGVTEAACKTLIKQRMCQSGMRWSIAASDALISLRALHLTPSRWSHFWKQHSQSLPDPL